MRKTTLYLLWAVLVILIAIQFIPLDRVNPIGDKNKDFLVLMQAPEDIQMIIHNACYDCHSNQTKWPWYSHVAPVSFMITEHVSEARDHVNFSEWGNYEREDQLSILKHMKKELDKNDMPLPGYVFLHSEAKLTAEHKALILDWMESISKD